VLVLGRIGGGSIIVVGGTAVTTVALSTVGFTFCIVKIFVAHETHGEGGNTGKGRVGVRGKGGWSCGGRLWDGWVDF
jgi:hypothetical protein